MKNGEWAEKNSAFSLASDPSDFYIFPIFIPLSLSSTPFRHQTGIHPFSSLLAALFIFLYSLGVFPFFSLSPLLYLCQLTCRGVECRSWKVKVQKKRNWYSRTQHSALDSNKEDDYKKCWRVPELWNEKEERKSRDRQCLKEGRERENNEIETANADITSRSRRQLDRGRQAEERCREVAILDSFLDSTYSKQQTILEA